MSVKVEENFGTILMNGTWFMFANLWFMVHRFPIEAGGPIHLRNKEVIKIL